MRVLHPQRFCDGLWRLVARLESYLQVGPCWGPPLASVRCAALRCAATVHGADAAMHAQRDRAAATRPSRTTARPSLPSPQRATCGLRQCPVGCNSYLTPPGTQGFAPHWDDIDAFVLQVRACRLALLGGLAAQLGSALGRRRRVCAAGARVPALALGTCIAGWSSSSALGWHRRACAAGVCGGRVLVGPHSRASWPRRQALLLCERGLPLTTRRGAGAVTNKATPPCTSSRGPSAGACTRPPSRSTCCRGAPGRRAGWAQGFPGWWRVCMRATAHLAGKLHLTPPCRPAALHLPPASRQLLEPRLQR